MIIIDRERLNELLIKDDIENEVEKNKDFIFGLIPELKEEVGFEQNNDWHIYDVWEHTKKAMANSENKVDIRLALLLHDIGKTKCYQDDEDGTRHFRGHAKKSAEMAKEILERLEYTPQQIELETCLIEDHSTIIDTDLITRRNLGFFKKLLDMQYADVKAYNPEKVMYATEKLDRVKLKMYEIEMDWHKKDREKMQNNSER